MASEAEGFICPYCLVGFASSGKLQSHFVDMHSGEGLVDDYDIVEYGNVDGEENEPFPSVLGHQFKFRRFSRPCTCDVCGEIIWQDGLMCNYCQVTIHVEKCEEKLDKMCSADSSESLDGLGETAQQTLSSQPQAPKGILPLVRRQIAKGRDRYVSEEFDLDLTYITERIIAMSYPASGVESAYRNNLKDVAKMLKTKHQDNYMIFNLSERSYDISKFNNQVLDFGWPDHLAPSLERLSSVCKSIKSWLDSDPQHVAVVHCKGGKGRTGCVIAAFMHYSEICQSAAAALDRFAMKRFYDNKLGGVTQPSQRKYVHYFSDLLAGKIDLQSPPVVLNHVIIHGIPNFDGKGGCRPFLKVYENMKLAHTSGLYVCSTEKERVKISVYGGLKLQGEILVKCFHKKIHKGMDSIFRCQFHSAVVHQDFRIVLGRQDLDDAFKDKRFPEGTKVEMLFEAWSPQGGGQTSTTPEPADIRTSLLDGKSNGNTDQQLTDLIAKRDSYASFQGGYDSGRPDDSTNTNLIQFDSPSQEHRKVRSMSTNSYNMDPERIERVLHPSSEQVYTVVSKPLKRTPTPDDAIQADLPVQHLYTAPMASKPRPNSAYVVPPSKPITVPSKPPPPKIVLKKFSPSGRPNRPTPPSKPARPPLPKVKAADEPDADYAEIDDDLPPVKEPKKEHKREAREEAGKGENVRGGEKRVVKGAAKPIGSAAPKANKSPNRSPNHRGKSPKRYLPSYDEVTPDRHIVVEPLPMRQSALDNDMWARFKFQTLPTPHADSLSRRSSSSDNLSSSDYYSTLADISIGVGPTGELSPQPLRRHSFSEGEERMIIIGTVNRDSIIPIGTLSAVEPDYKNVGQYGDANYTEPGKVLPRGKDTFVQPTYENTVLNGGVGGEGAECDQDYMNQDPEGLFHTYSNQDDLMQQMRAENLPVPEPSTNTSDGTDNPPQQPQTSWFTGAALLKFLRPPFAVFGKPRHQEIHSGKILEEERLSTLAPFTLSGTPQVGRDYEAFTRKESAWGEHPQAPKDREQDRRAKALKLPLQPGHRNKDPAVEDLEEKEKPAARMSPVMPRKPKKVPHVPQANSPQLLSPPEGAPPPPPKASSPLVPRKPFHPPLAKKPSAPTPAPRPQAHQKLQASSSVDEPQMMRGKARDPTPSDLVVKKRNAPPKPPPPYTHDQKKAPSESTVKSLMPYWYRPNITRDEAIDVVRQLESGSFIVRDSQTVSGGYALTIKVSEKQVRQRRKLAEDTPVTEDMCVTHFLIQPDPEGVKLQGWSEKAFKSLPEFIAQHTVEKLCLPCKLVLPKSGPSSRRRPATMKQALITGAACDLVSLGSVDVSGPGSDSLLAQTVQQMKSLELSNMNIVTFKASKEGITLTDNINGMYIKRQYPISSVTFCGLDPNDTRWDFPHLQHLGETVSLKSKPCFGIFYRPQDNSGFSCLLFAEFDSSQPVTSVVSYVQRIMKHQRQ